MQIYTQMPNEYQKENKKQQLRHELKTTTTLVQIK